MGRLTVSKRALVGVVLLIGSSGTGFHIIIAVSHDPDVALGALLNLPGGVLHAVGFGGE